MQSSRRNDLAKIHIAKQQLAMDDSAYEALLLRVGGAVSAAEMGPTERRAVLTEMQRLGWKPTPPKRALGSGRKASAPAPEDERKTALALWIQLHAAGAVHDPSDSALAAFARRQTGIDHWRWTDGKAAWRVIEALKAWLARVELKAVWSRCYSAGAVVQPPDEVTIARAAGASSFGRIKAAAANKLIRELHALLEGKQSHVGPR